MTYDERKEFLYSLNARCNIEHYWLLRNRPCDEDETGLQEWKERVARDHLVLQGANLQYANLQGINLPSANLQGANLSYANIQGAALREADLQGAILQGTDLRATNLEQANLQEAILHLADLRGTQNLQHVSFQKASLLGAKFQETNLSYANFKGADLRFTEMQGASLFFAELQGANIEEADIRGADFSDIIVDGETFIGTIKVDRKTDFSGVGLSNTRVVAGLRQLLEYNVRRKRWKIWYRENPHLAAPVWLFWALTDYGFSTWRIILSIIFVSYGFAVAYLMNPTFLDLNPHIGELRGFVHALYFSVVTTTTLGFGDIHASPDSTGGQLTLMGHVLLGYVLLGALITRLAVVFSNDGPTRGFYDGRPDFYAVTGTPLQQWMKIHWRILLWKIHLRHRQIVDTLGTLWGWVPSSLRHAWDEFAERIRGQ